MAMPQAGHCLHVFCSSESTSDLASREHDSKQCYTNLHSNAHNEDACTQGAEECVLAVCSKKIMALYVVTSAGGLPGCVPGSVTLLPACETPAHRSRSCCLLYDGA